MMIDTAEVVKKTIEKYRDYQIAWLTSHHDIELCEEEEGLIIGFLKDTAECATTWFEIDDDDSL